MYIHGCRYGITFRLFKRFQPWSESKTPSKVWGEFKLKRPQCCLYVPESRASLKTLHLLWKLICVSDTEHLSALSDILISCLLIPTSFWKGMSAAPNRNCANFSFYRKNQEHSILLINVPSPFPGFQIFDLFHIWPANLSSLLLNLIRIEALFSPDPIWGKTHK